jgi:hypothetical protein
MLAGMRRKSKFVLLKARDHRPRSFMSYTLTKSGAVKDGPAFSGGCAAELEIACFTYPASRLRKTGIVGFIALSVMRPRSTE